MSFKSQINHYRRTIMKALTGNIGNRFLAEKGKIDPNFKINRVLICRPNQRLGNTLLITPLVQDIILFNPNVSIDLFVKGGVSHVIFENYPQINQIFKLPSKPFKELYKYLKIWFKIRSENYDLVINVHEESASGRIATKVSRSKFKLFGDEFIKDLNRDEQVHLGKIPVYQFRKFIEALTNVQSHSDFPKLNLKLSEYEIDYGKKILSELIQDSSKETIAFFTYATGSKCYVAEWWDKFYLEFTNEFSNKYNLIEILPVENISMLNRKLPTFYSQNIREIAAVIDNCSLLIAADSGMMHLGCATSTKNIGLFKSNNFKKYQPYGSGNCMYLVSDLTSDGLVEEMKEVLKINVNNAHNL
ncbi:MAG TPA: glycosyltransferase family 9 protein [Faecalibacter sp.]